MLFGAEDLPCCSPRLLLVIRTTTVLEPTSTAPRAMLSIAVDVTLVQWQETPGDFIAPAPVAQIAETRGRRGVRWGGVVKGGGGNGSGARGVGIN